MRLLYKVEVDSLKDAIKNYENLLLKLSVGVVTTDTPEECVERVITSGSLLIDAIEAKQDLEYFGE